MKRFFLGLYLILTCLGANAQLKTPGDSATISLITCSPGKEVYAQFGHTAIRVNDPNNGIDVVFNYGIFSFDTPNFYYKFVKGETDYQLGVYDTRYFIPEYQERNSMVWEQVLNLTSPEKQRLIQSLLINNEPQNRLYRYNFIFDNCATRPRDMILKALDGKIENRAINETKTFRQWVGNYVGEKTWVKFGIDLTFGLDADKLASREASMFLPEILMKEMQTVRILASNGTTRNLVSENNILVDKVPEKPEVFTWFSEPMLMCTLLLIIGIFITVWDTKRKRHYKPFDSALLIVSGITGLIVFYLMFFSVHPLVKYNYNLLWLNPLNLLAGIMLWFRRFRFIVFYFQLLNILLLVGALIVFALTLQELNVATFPLIVLLLIRSTSWFAIKKSKQKKNKEVKKSTIK